MIEVDMIHINGMMNTSFWGRGVFGDRGKMLSGAFIKPIKK